ncbi:MAG: OmpA family protein [Desulfovibrio sp.]|jgi:chemotaxis protein MotB|nr:OmpA family protein [Desulfovibrio sp.]
MTRRRAARREIPTEPGLWLPTFSDMMTLLLAFFVLLLSMSGLDGAALARISAWMRDPAAGGGTYGGKAGTLVAGIVKAPSDPAGYRALLTAAAVDPTSDFGRYGAAGADGAVLAHREGVVIILTDALLFRPGSAFLEPSGKALLDALTPAIKALNAEVNISGHTDSGPVHEVSDPEYLYELSWFRAAAALEHFLQGGVQAERFSVSGYGPDKALYPNDTPEGKRKNRRLEILVKTAPLTASYS